MHLVVVPEELVKALLLRHSGGTNVSQPPLAVSAGRVPVSFEHFGHCNIIVAQRNTTRITPHARMAHMKPGH
ncbi:hypothetical protein ES703_43372 [subsurface metagenome]